MNNNQLKIRGHYSVPLGGVPRLVIHANFCRPEPSQQFFLLSLPAGFVSLGVAQAGASQYWMGAGDPVRSRQLGELISRTNGVVLPPVTLDNPFSGAAVTGSLPSFYIDNILVEQVPGEIWDTVAVYYRLHVEPGWWPVICKQRLPMNHHYDWCPVSEASEQDLPAMKELIEEYESGVYQVAKDMNGRLERLLQGLG